jgi:threonylcarbamoyladenosine tRNA methylthiotransferase MtaB
MKKQTVGIYTLGCRLNIYESDGILNQFISNGYQAVNWEDGPDIAIINTCTVTSHADSKNRYIIRNLLKKNPSAKIIVTGCYAQTDQEELQKIPGVWAIIGNEKKSKIFEIYQQKNSNEEKVIYSTGPLNYFEESKKRRPIEDPFSYGNVVPINHTRAYLKIQDGCDRKCSYCKIPMARGGGISRSIEDILYQVDQLEASKIPEIVLTGVNIGWYRYKHFRFNDLIEKILERLKFSRLRISSIEPSDVNERLAELSLHPKFCNFLHVPLQSGSDKILRMMKRSYNSKTFSLRIEKVLKINPDIFLGTDVIVGFPTETEEDFRKTIDLILNLNFVNIHAFPFSLRKDTEIEKFVQNNKSTLVPKHIVQNRINELFELKEKQMLKYLKNSLYKMYQGIVEEIANGYIKVLTENYLYVKIPHKENNFKKGMILQVQICDFYRVFNQNTKKYDIEILGRIV